MDFHKNALEAYIVALNLGKQDDSEFIKYLAYQFYEEDLCLKNSEIK